VIKLTPEQNGVVEGIIARVEAAGAEPVVITCGGFAGTGKSTCAGVLKARLPGFVACAFTGKAAAVLRNKGMSARTIHSLIYNPGEDPDTGKPAFLLKDHLSVDGFLVDEASMVAFEQDVDLKSFKKPIIYIGDHGQLEPVSRDPGLMRNPEFRLETIHRNAGEIAFFAQHLRLSHLAHDYQAKSKVTLLPSHSAVTDEMLLSVDQVICAFNRTRCEINARIRRLQNRRDIVAVGERIICLRNNRGYGVFNGMQGIVEWIDYKFNVLSFAAEDGSVYDDIPFDPNAFGAERYDVPWSEHAPIPFDYASCCTCHKFQGSEASRVLVYEQRCSKWAHERWAYTAASRAKDALIWACG
jgi:exodeoxyribonuclease-5